MMVRTQVSFDDDELRRAKTRAAELGVSLAEFVRRAVHNELGERPRQGDISELFGMFSSGHSDTSQRVDEIVSESSWKDFERTRRER